MDRKKPTLTSPSKVGLLVALLMVVTALGVSYLITGTFSLTWHWIHFADFSPATWTFNLGAFIEEMAPLLVLTALLSVCAFLLVAGAVRRYKAYVDSGSEYKELLKSIKSIEDLDNVDLPKKLKRYPELRDFLLSIKHGTHSRERDEERKAPAGAHAPAEETPKLASESSVLVSAIVSGPEAFAKELAMTVPELKQIERALREHYVATSLAAPAAPASNHEAEGVRDAVRGTLESMRRDVVECGSASRELETALAALSSELQTVAQPAAAPATDNSALQKRIDGMAEGLSSLGEETKRIAIAAALQASGGPEADNIKVAEELRVIATRFNTVAGQWQETVAMLNQALTSGGAVAAPAVSPRAASAAASAVKRARLWGDRAVALNEHLRAIERVVGVDGNLAGDTQAPAMAQEETQSAVESDDFISRGANDVFQKSQDGDVSFADIPGFEKEHQFFGEGTSSDSGASDDQFEVESAHEQSWDLKETSEAEQAADVEIEETSDSQAADNDGFLTGPRPVVSPKTAEHTPSKPDAKPAPKPARPAAKKPAEKTHDTPVATATADPDADAIDLYALGAVDCVETI